MFSVDLPHRIAVLMPSPPNVERVVPLVKPSLDSPGRNMTVTGIHPGQVTVARSNENLQRRHEIISQHELSMFSPSYIIFLLAVLLPSPGNIAAVVLRVNLACRTWNSRVLYPVKLLSLPYLETDHLHVELSQHREVLRHLIPRLSRPSLGCHPNHLV